MFCSKTLNSKMDNIHKRVLRADYINKRDSFENLLLRDKSCNIHTRNIQMLMTEIYKSINHLNALLIWEIFSIKTTEYNLRSTNPIIIPRVKTAKYGTNSIVFKVSLLWNSIQNFCKDSQNVEEFQMKIKGWGASTCTSTICKN